MPVTPTSLSAAVQHVAKLPDDHRLSVRDIATLIKEQHPTVKRHFDMSLRNVLEAMPHSRNEKRFFLIPEVRKYLVFVAAVDLCEYNHTKAVQYLKDFDPDELWSCLQNSIETLEDFLYKNRTQSRPNGEDHV